MEKINKCICGKTPEFIEKRTCYAHGEYPLEGWIECECGIKTKKFIIDGYYECKDTKDTVIKFWNNKIKELYDIIKRKVKTNEN